MTEESRLCDLPQAIRKPTEDATVSHAGTQESAPHHYKNKHITNTSSALDPQRITSRRSADTPQALRTSHHQDTPYHRIASHHATRIMHARYRELHHARIYIGCTQALGIALTHVYIGLHHVPTHAHDTLIQ